MAAILRSSATRSWSRSGSIRRLSESNEPAMSSPSATSRRRPDSDIADRGLRIAAPIRDPRTALRNPQSVIHNPQSVIRNPQSAIGNPQSVIRNPQSAMSLLRGRELLFQQLLLVQLGVEAVLPDERVVR